MDGFIMENWLYKNIVKIAIVITLPLWLAFLSESVMSRETSKLSGPLTTYLSATGIEGDFTIMQGKTEFKAVTGRLVDGKRDGDWTYYFPQSNKVWSVERYNNDRPVGVWILYREDGRIKMRDDLNKKRNDAFNRPSPACMGAAKGYHSEACIGNLKNNRARQGN